MACEKIRLIMSSIYRKVGLASLIMMTSVFLSRLTGLIREQVIAYIGIRFHHPWRKPCEVNGDSHSVCRHLYVGRIYVGCDGD